jgi:hypothetical protein
MRPTLSLAIVLSSLLAALPAAADVVELKSGARLEGKVKVQELGKFVVVELTSGVQKTVMWDDVKEIEIGVAKDPKGTPKELPPGGPASGPQGDAGAGPADGPAAKPKYKKKLDKTTLDAQVDKGGAGVTYTHECGDGDPSCHQEASVKVAGGEVKGAYHAEEDCSGDGDEACVKKTAGTFGKDGLRLSVSRESARRVTSPRTGSTGFGLSVSYLFGFADNVLLTGYNVGVSLRMMTGGLFPGPQGGSWTGFFVEPSAQLSYATTEVKVPGGPRQKSESGLLLFNGSAGVQWMSFGKQNPKSLKQDGWGLFAGGTAGAVVPFGRGDTTATYGPVFGYVKSEYNPGTGSFETLQLNVFLLPTSDLFLLLVGAQANFG